MLQYVYVYVYVYTHTHILAHIAEPVKRILENLILTRSLTLYMPERATAALRGF